MASSQESSLAVSLDTPAASSAQAMLDEPSSHRSETNETSTASGRKTRRRNNKSRSISAVDDLRDTTAGSGTAAEGSAVVEGSRLKAGGLLSKPDEAEPNGKLGKQPDLSKPNPASKDSSEVAKAKAAVVKAKSKAQRSAKVKKAIELANKQNGSSKETAKRGGPAAKQGPGKAKAGGGKASGKSTGKGASQNKKGSGIPQSTQSSGSEIVSAPADGVDQVDKTSAGTVMPAMKSLVAAAAPTHKEPLTATKPIVVSDHADALPKPGPTSSKSPQHKPVASNTQTRRMRPGKAARQQAKLESPSRANPTEAATGETLPTDRTPLALPATSPVDDSVAIPSSTVETLPAASMESPTVNRARADRGTKRGRVADESSPAVTSNSDPNGESKTPVSKPAPKKARLDKVNPVHASVSLRKASTAPIATMDNKAFAKQSELQRELEQTVLRLKVAELEIQKLKLEAELARSRSIGSVVDE